MDPRFWSSCTGLAILGRGWDLIPLCFWLSALVRLGLKLSGHQGAVFLEVWLVSCSQLSTLHKHIIALAGEKVNQAIFDKSLDATCTTQVPHGTTERLMLNSSRRYLKLKEPNGN